MPERPDPRRPSGPAAPQRVEDPRSIRALAHPARLAIINALATGEELTATQCAQLTGLSPSATAYHLNLLERYGYAEPAPPRPDRRERPWRAAGRPTGVDLDTSTPAGASAAAAVIGAYIETTRALAVEFTMSGHAEPAPWRDAVLANTDVWLTPDEFRRVAQDLDAVLEPYRDRHEERPPGSRRVRVMTVVVPYRSARRPGELAEPGEPGGVSRPGE